MTSRLLRRPAQRLIAVLACLLVVVIVAAQVQRHVGWAWGLVGGVAFLAAVSWWSFRPSKASRHRVSVRGTDFEHFDPRGTRTAFSLTDVTELAVQVVRDGEDTVERTWHIRVQGRVEPVAVPFFATGDESFYEWLDLLPGVDSPNIWTEEPGRRVVWSADAGWTAPPAPPRDEAPVGRPSPMRWRLKAAAGFVVPIGATAFLARALTNSDAVAAFAVLAWLFPIALFVFRREPEAGYRVEIADDVIRVATPDGPADVHAEDLREVACESRISFLQGDYVVLQLIAVDGRVFEFPTETEGTDALVERLETLPGWDTDRQFDAWFDTFEGLPGVRRVAWTRP